MAIRGSPEWKENIRRGVIKCWAKGKYKDTDFSMTASHKKKLSDSRKGKTYEEIYGKELAGEMRQVRRQQAMYNNPNKDKKHPGLNRGKKYALGTHWPEEAKIKFSEKLGGPCEDFYTPIKSEWRELSQKIRERDNFTCQSCHKKLPSNCLDVHHIRPFKISHDNSESNLITLCKPCHISIERFTRLQYREVSNAKTEGFTSFTQRPESVESGSTEDV
jgi:hypothetical protein